MSRRQQSKHERRRAKDLAYAKSQGGWSKARPATAGRGCPTPQKRRFASQESAARECPPGRVPYRCPCGDWHLKTKKKSRTNLDTQENR